MVADDEKGARPGRVRIMRRRFTALKFTAMLLADPGLPADIAEQLRGRWDGSEDHLSAIIPRRIWTPTRHQ